VVCPFAEITNLVISGLINIIVGDNGEKVTFRPCWEENTNLMAEAITESFEDVLDDLFTYI
jgi:hypothetical protein